MTDSAIGRILLSPVSIGSPCSYALEGDYIIGRLFGLITLTRIHLGAVHYLRLATRREVSPAHLLLKWPEFILPSHRAHRPVYILQTRKGNRLFLSLEGSSHFRLRQAIARHSDRRSHRLAA